VNPAHGRVGLAQRDLNTGGGELDPQVDEAHPVTDKEQPHPVAPPNRGAAYRRHDLAVARVAVTGEHHGKVHNSQGEGLGLGLGLGVTTIGGGGSLVGLGEGACVGTSLGIDAGDDAGGVQLGVLPWRM
jgi:hypothetical protein